MAWCSNFTVFTVHCAEKIVSARWRTGSVSAERVGQEEVGQGEVGQGEVEQGEVGGVTCRVLCTWQLLGFGCERTMVGTGWANSA